MILIEAPGRIYAEDEAGTVLAEILFPDDGEDAVRIERTFVHESLRGQGVAGKLMEAAVASAHGRGRRILPVCSYAKDWLAKHSEHSET